VTTEDKVQSENLPPAQISLTDCLACSGCVTSAEAVLISLQSHAEVLNTLDAHPPTPLIVQDDGHINSKDPVSRDGKIFVASISPQVRASLAATYGISEREAGYMVDQFLRGPHGLRAGGKHGNGFTWVVDTNVIREAVLSLTAEEVRESLGSADSTPGGSRFPVPKRPILSSACPGWICYAEKTHPHVLPHLSRLKSPQALSGTFLKTMLSRVLDIPTSQIWHLAIMPCFDKKLEASREELTDKSWQSGDGMVPSEDQPATRDVDCVITSRELLMLASSRGISLPALPLKSLPSTFAPRFPDKTVDSFLSPRSPFSKQTAAFGTSGGYLHYVLTSYQCRHPDSRIVTQRGRNADVVEYTLMSGTGEPILKAARYYGFRNIQNLVRKLKPVRASRLPGAKTMTGPRGAARRAGGVSSAGTGSGPDYAYVEVMACPGGCTNGGGQIRVEDAREANSSSQAPSSGLTSDQAQKPSPHEQRAWLARVDEAYFSADSESDAEFEATVPQTSILDMESRIHDIMSYWSRTVEIPLEKLVYTTYRKVESDVGKDKNVGDTARVVELAGKIGGGW
jgi:iron only hydrogenase large subunit-like protein